MRSGAVCSKRALAACGGCDALFGLTPVEDVEDAPPVDGGCPLDEDGDCIEDLVDNCPGVANPEQADNLEREVGALADGVGDACDPNPSLAGDHLLAFESFADPVAAAALWLDASINGKWVFAPGEVRHSDATDNYALLKRAVPVDNAELSVEAAFSFGAWNPAMSNTRLGVIIDSRQTEYPGHQCWAEPDVGGERVVLQEYVEGAVSDAASVPLGELVFDARFVLRIPPHRARPARLSCHPAGRHAERRASADPDRAVVRRPLRGDQRRERRRGAALRRDLWEVTSPRSGFAARCPTRTSRRSDPSPRRAPTRPRPAGARR